MQILKFKLAGLTCQACKKLSEKRIMAIPGVKEVEVNLDSGEATINSNRDVQIQEIKAVLRDTPYQVTQ